MDKVTMRKAIVAIQKRGEYPSAIRINKEAGRSHRRDLNGRECAIRRELFRELGIVFQDTYLKQLTEKQRQDYVGLGVASA